VREDDENISLAFRDAYISGLKTNAFYCARDLFELKGAERENDALFFVSSLRFQAGGPGSAL
jgi:hypothetical protein